MEIQILSKEIIKPSSPSTLQKKPYKLCLFDQLIPSTYSPFIFFYPNNPQNSDSIKTLKILKKSFSEALNLYYPFSGRITDNLEIDNFNEGVPCTEAQTNFRMSDFLKRNEIEWLNFLLPYRPFSKEISINMPIVALQFTKFSCGRISIGICGLHKLIDGPTTKCFFTTWSSICRGNLDNIVHPNYDESSKFFPPRISFPENHLSLMQSLWFTESNYVTRRFAFDAKAISTLRSNLVFNFNSKPSRTEILSCLIWKYCMKASEALSGGTSKPSILVEAVNLRPRTTPPMSTGSMGNIFWWATAIANPSDDNATEVQELVKLLSDAIALYKSDYTQSFQGDNGYETMSDYCNQLEDLFSVEKPDTFAFTTWCYLGFTKLNFGWGEPFWTGIVGKVGSAFRNLTIFIETKDGKGIEAWITLDQPRMALLEKDPQFLAFASPNPKISSL